MADVSVKMGVSGVAQFKQGMAQAQASVKSIDAALKLNEKQFRATGDAEAYMQNKTTQLNSKLQAQQTAVKNAEQALKTMKESGVDPLSASYQKMETALLNAQSAVLDTQNEINELGTVSAEASGQTDQLANSLGGLNKKVSLEQVRSAIGSITTGMENAAKKAAELGKAIWDEVMDTARRADDTATMALMWDIPLQRYKQMQALVTGGMDTTVESMLSAQDKLNRGIGNNSSAVLDVLRELNLLKTQGGKYGNEEIIPEDSVQLFWEAGQALMEMSDAYDKEAAASALFGRSWKELKPLFDTYKSIEEYNEALENVSVSSEDATKNSAELADRVGELENTWTQLKDEIFGAISPALSGAATALEGLLSTILEYLQTPEGKQALEDMGKAVEGLFSDLSKIDPQEVVAGFSEVFTDIVGGLEWLSTNSGTVIGALEAIVIGWGTLKLAGGALDIMKLIQGITGLTATSTITQAGTAAGAAWGSSFASAVLKAAPWLAGLITLLTPTNTESNSLADAEGNLTAEGLMVQAQEQENARIQEERETRRANGTQTYDDWLLEMAQKYIGDYLATSALYENFAFQAAQEYWDKYRTHTATTEDWQALNDAFGEGGDAGRAALQQIARVMYSTDKAVEDLPKEAFGMYDNFEEAPIIQIDPIPPEDAAEKISSEIGEVPITLVIRDIEGSELEELLGGADGEHANGLWSVPFDGYHAILHRGERVVPAREVNSSRNFSSNLYVESMYMNNGQDADGLAAAMAAAQRRTMSGYGS